MNSFLVIYDITLQSDTLVNYIKSTYSSWAKIFQNAWIIKTDKSVAQVRDEIIEQYTSGKVLVIDVSKTAWASSNFVKDVVEWMKNNL